MVRDRGLRVQDDHAPGQSPAPRLDGEDHSKDIDFANSSIRARWQAGLADAQRAVAAEPWQRPADPLEGIIVHDINED